MGYRRDSPGYGRSRSPRSRSGSPYSRRSYSRSLSPRGRSRSPAGAPRPPGRYFDKDRGRAPPYKDRSRSRSSSGGASMPLTRGNDGLGRHGGGGLSRGRGRQPPRGHSPPYRRYSRSRSGTPSKARGRASRSRSGGRSRSRSSSQEPGQIPAAHRRLQQGKQQRAPAGPATAAADLALQLQALRQQLESEQAGRAAAEGRVEFLKGKVRDVAERSKQRGNMLAQLTLAARRVADARQQLQDAEGELQLALTAAEAYLQEDAPAAPPLVRPAAEGCSPPPPNAPESQLPPQQQQHLAAAVNGQAGGQAAAAGGADEGAAAAAAGAAAAPAGVDGGWVEAAPAAAGPLQNIKFKLKL